MMKKYFILILAIFFFIKPVHAMQADVHVWTGKLVYSATVQDMIKLRETKIQSINDFLDAFIDVFLKFGLRAMAKSLSEEGEGDKAYCVLNSNRDEIESYLFREYQNGTLVGIDKYFPLMILVPLEMCGVSNKNNRKEIYDEVVDSLLGEMLSLAEPDTSTVTYVEQYRY